MKGEELLLAKCLQPDLQVGFGDNDLEELLVQFAPSDVTALHLYEQLRDDLRTLPTGSSCIDHLLSGGVREGCVVEVCGPSASGKTQLCHSLAASIAAMGEGVMYLDTTNSFSSVRLLQLTACARGQQVSELDRSFLKHVTVCRLHSLYDLISFLCCLDKQLQSDKRHTNASNAMQQQPGQTSRTTPTETGSAMRTGSTSTGPGPSDTTSGTSAGNAVQKIYHTEPSVIIVDSISALISPVLGANDKRYMNQGYVLMTGVSRALKHIATTHGVAIMVTNHVTESRADAADELLGNAGSNAPRDYVPALGDLWRGQPHMRIQLHMMKDPQGPRAATLAMCPVMAASETVHFRITPSGLESNMAAA